MKTYEIYFINEDSSLKKYEIYFIYEEIIEAILEEILIMIRSPTRLSLDNSCSSLSKFLLEDL